MASPKPSSSDGLISGLFVLAAILAIGPIAFGGYLLVHQQPVAGLLLAGAAALVLILVTLALTLSISSARSAAEVERTVHVATLNQKLDQISALLTNISEQQLLSDRAKAVAFREKDREVLRRAIREEMTAKNWDAALVLANDMEREFGYTQEAATLRVEINNNRSEVMRKQIGETVTAIEQFTRAEQWTAALREADRLMHIYSNEEQVKRLPLEIESRRQNHKKQLLESWKEAVARKDVDGSIEVLKRLDTYLTPAEAEAMQETARGIFKEKLNILKNQFSQNVQEHRWSEAIRIGDSIMRDFPNSRLALEVKDMMDTLRQRAAGHAEAAKV